MPNPHVLITAGDPSGDQHGAALVRALKTKHPDLYVSAMGGVHLKAVADQFLFSLVGLGGFGFWEPLLKIPRLLKALGQIKALLRKNPPQIVVPIDYYGFNIHVARAAHQRNISVVYYISPQVWASRPGRIKKLAKVLTKMLVIFPFESDLYRQAGVPVRFVGHPLLDQVPEPVSPNRVLNIGLMPGSRWSIVERHLPIMIHTAQELLKTFPQAQFTLFRPAELEETRYQPFLNTVPWIQLAHDPQYEKRKKLSLAITVSGTAALENTLLGVPMVVMYKLSALTYQIARQIIRVPYVAIPNILANQALIPELLQEDATPTKLAAAARALLENPQLQQQMRQDLLSLRSRLGTKGAVQTAAEEIASFFKS